MKPRSIIVILMLMVILGTTALFPIPVMAAPAIISVTPNLIVNDGGDCDHNHSRHR
jgi:hypothetical protein